MGKFKSACVSHETKRRRTRSTGGDFGVGGSTFPKLMREEGTNFRFNFVTYNYLVQKPSKPVKIRRMMM